MYLFTYISPRAFSQDLRQTAGGATVDPPEDDDDRGGGEAAAVSEPLEAKERSLRLISKGMQAQGGMAAF